MYMYIIRTCTVCPVCYVLLVEKIHHSLVLFLEVLHVYMYKGIMVYKKF